MAGMEINIVRTVSTKPTLPDPYADKKGRHNCGRVPCEECLRIKQMTREEFKEWFDRKHNGLR